MLRLWRWGCLAAAVVQGMAQSWVGLQKQAGSEPSPPLHKSVWVSENLCHLLIPLTHELNMEEGGALKCLR